MSGIYKKAQTLLQFPKSGYKYEGSAEEIRILLYGHYRITYKIADEQIIVLGVFHGALAIERYLI